MDPSRLALGGWKGGAGSFQDGLPAQCVVLRRAPVCVCVCVCVCR